MDWSHLLSVLETGHETTMAQLATYSLFNPMLKSPAETVIRGLNLASPSFYTGRLHLGPILSEIYKTVSRNPDNTLPCCKFIAPFSISFLNSTLEFIFLKSS
jgi:hypothetical protein